MRQISENGGCKIGTLLFTKFPQVKKLDPLGLELRKFVIVFRGLKLFCSFVRVPKSTKGGKSDVSSPPQKVMLGAEPIVSCSFVDCY